MTATQDASLYSVAGEEMDRLIEVYLAMADATSGFSVPTLDVLATEDQRRIILGGIGSPLEASESPENVLSEWRRMQAVPFSAEEAVTRGVYVALAGAVRELLGRLSAQSKGFTDFSAELIADNPSFLPVFQRLLNVSSKSKLKELVGSVSDNSISKPAAQRIVEQLRLRRGATPPTVEQLQAAMAPTLEGIVRDLVGRVLLESVVASALDGASVPYKREDEYSGIEGVVYKFRADFVIPNADAPLVFIEVRKSSSRHASLYAKDKMFSAINWKGHNEKLMAVLITEGPWTAQTLQVMSRVFDYVIPLNKSMEVADVISKYLAGDESQLKTLINFSITPAGGR
ncbi:hypothetical protein [Tessaracoccus lapidicaptus]|uniref:hypothetical protein n=1 Tax=Tessaracoccus lapidicaptus TaxID=1427523 RepID=UPI00334024C9